mmetsp:Transcript_25097/g.65461  ORF Transcript_25097/g.65461 Transcript_25097/m.65461 type:complete len:245 (-) Transcript_25097:1201-1935(-)
MRTSCNNSWWLISNRASTNGSAVLNTWRWESRASRMMPATSTSSLTSTSFTTFTLTKSGAMACASTATVVASEMWVSRSVASLATIPMRTSRANPSSEAVSIHSKVPTACTTSNASEWLSSSARALLSHCSLAISAEFVGSIVSAQSALMQLDTDAGSVKSPVRHSSSSTAIVPASPNLLAHSCLPWHSAAINSNAICASICEWSCIFSAASTTSGNSTRTTSAWLGGSLGSAARSKLSPVACA